MRQSDIHTELAQLPVDVLTKYLGGELSTTEVEAVEVFLEENPMYADALEGLKEMPNPSSAQLATHELRHKTRNLLKKRAPARIKQFNFMQYATAAVAVLVVLFIASTVLFFNTDNSHKPNQATTEAAPADAHSGEFADKEEAETPEEMAGDAKVVTLGDDIEEREDNSETEVSPSELISSGDKPESENAPKTVEKPKTETPQPSSATGAGAAPSGNVDPDSRKAATVTINAENERTLSREEEKAYADAITVEEYKKKREQQERIEKERALKEKQNKESELDYGDTDGVSDLNDNEPNTYDDDFAEEETIKIEDGIATDEVVVTAQGVEKTPAANAPSKTSSDVALESVTVGSTKTKKPKKVRQKGDRSKAKDNKGRTQESSDDLAIDIQKPVYGAGSTDSTVNSLDRAIGYYNNKQYEQAVNSLQQILVATPENYQAQYYLGNSYQNLNKSGEAVPYLKNVVAIPDSAFFESARWNLANAYIQVDNKTSARSLLEEIANQPGEFQQQAKELLKQLK